MMGYIITGIIITLITVSIGSILYEYIKNIRRK